MVRDIYNVMKDSRGGQTLFVLTAEDLDNMCQRLISETIKTVEAKYEPSYYSREELQELLHVGSATIYNYIKSGMLKPIKMGRRILFDKQLVRRAIEEGKLGRYCRR